jgi:HSP20 family protein
VTVRKWDPLQDLLTLQERMNRLFEESFAGRLDEDNLMGAGTWAPLADAYETAEGFVVDLEAARHRRGRRRQIQIEATRSSSRRAIRGAGAKPDRFHRMERSHGPFLRSFKLTEAVDPERVTAQLRDGILRVELTKVRGRAGWRRERE